MISEHTPGPWSIEPFNVTQALRADCGIFAAVDGIATAVCRCPNYAGQAQWETDSKLIAAAPDLLEALKYARRFLATDTDTAFVDAAIAKAQGK